MTCLNWHPPGHPLYLSLYPPLTRYPPKNTNPIDQSQVSQGDSPSYPHLKLSIPIDQSQVSLLILPLYPPIKTLRLLPLFVSLKVLNFFCQIVFDFTNHARIQQLAKFQTKSMTWRKWNKHREFKLEIFIFRLRLKLNIHLASILLVFF